MLAFIDLRKLDISDRLVCGIQDQDFSVGYHNVQLDDLSPGIYLCRMNTDDFTTTHRFVVIQ